MQPRDKVDGRTVDAWHELPDGKLLLSFTGRGPRKVVYDRESVVRLRGRSLPYEKAKKLWGDLVWKRETVWERLSNADPPPPPPSLEEEPQVFRHKETGEVTVARFRRGKAYYPDPKNPNLRYVTDLERFFSQWDPVLSTFWDRIR